MLLWLVLRFVALLSSVSMTHCLTWPILRPRPISEILFNLFNNTSKSDLFHALQWCPQVCFWDSFKQTMILCLIIQKHVTCVTWQWIYFMYLTCGYLMGFLIIFSVWNNHFRFSPQGFCPTLSFGFRSPSLLACYTHSIRDRRKNGEGSGKILKMLPK